MPDLKEIKKGLFYEFVSDLGEGFLTFVPDYTPTWGDYCILHHYGAAIITPDKKVITTYSQFTSGSRKEAWDKAIKWIETVPTLHIVDVHFEHDPIREGEIYEVQNLANAFYWATLRRPVDEKRRAAKYWQSEKVNDYKIGDEIPESRIRTKRTFLTENGETWSTRSHSAVYSFFFNRREAGLYDTVRFDSSYLANELNLRGYMPEQVEQEVRRVDFRYKGKIYYYEFRAGIESSQAYLYHGAKCIYDGREIMEGREIYLAVFREINQLRLLD